jgi:hypothetical protein
MNKPRAILFTALSVCLISASLAQAADWATSSGSCYAKGDKIISGGVSLFWFGAFGAFDYGFHDCISGGGAVGYNTYSFSSYYRVHYIPIIVRAAFHPFNLKVLADKIKVRDKLDVYVGPSIGWSINFITSKSTAPLGLGEPDISGFIFREYLGVRYYFSDKFGVFAEDCAGLGAICFGVSFKL